jgi:hypothetical protein
MDSFQKLASEKIVGVLGMELFEDSKAYSSVGIIEKDPLSNEIKKKLTDDLKIWQLTL